MPEMFLETEIVDRMIIMKMPAMSSTTRMPNTSWAKFSFSTPSSENALMMMVVELMESMPPRKMESMFPQPSASPVRYPRVSMPATTVVAVMIAPAPTLISFLKLNSRPRQNISTMMPISLQVSMDAVSCAVKK